jgi:hypothetical protein
MHLSSLNSLTPLAIRGSEVPTGRRNQTILVSGSIFKKNNPESALRATTATKVHLGTRDVIVIRFRSQSYARDEYPRGLSSFLQNEADDTDKHVKIFDHG